MVSRHVVVGVAVTALALASAWHSGRHVWNQLTYERTLFAPLSAVDRRREPLTHVQIPGDVFDWYRQYLVHGDRAYFQVQPGGFSSLFDYPTLFGIAARFYLLPAVETTDPRKATVVISYHADPRLLHLRFVTQQEAGIQPIFVSRVSTP